MLGRLPALQLAIHLLQTNLRTNLSFKIMTTAIEIAIASIVSTWK
jgi:hypothetical protein